MTQDDGRDRSAQAAREARLAAALRENLKRRKAQARGRRSADAQDETADEALDHSQVSSSPATSKAE